MSVEARNVARRRAGTLSSQQSAQAHLWVLDHSRPTSSYRLNPAPTHRGQHCLRYGPEYLTWAMDSSSFASNIGPGSGQDPCHASSQWRQALGHCSSSRVQVDNTPRQRCHSYGSSPQSRAVGAMGATIQGVNIFQKRQEGAAQDQSVDHLPQFGSRAVAIPWRSPSAPLYA